MRQLVPLGAILCLLISPLVSTATVIGACDTNRQGSCIDSVDINSTGTQFTIVLTNTGPSANGRFLTAAAFNLPGELSATLATTGTSFTLVSGAIKVAPINIDREFLLTIDPRPSANNSFEGGGSPKRGIAPGSTVTFVFNIVGGTLTDSFANESSILNSQVTRFRGNSHGGSDNDPALVIASTFAPLLVGPNFIIFSDPSNPAVVPGPQSLAALSVAQDAAAIPEAASFLLVGMGLVAFGIVGKRRNGGK